jgi:putative ABC transport system ATP-binding protein
MVVEQAVLDRATDLAYATPGSDIVIRTDDLWRTYVMGAEEVHALRGVSFEVKRGEYMAIMGPSGSGKSTMMNLIGCLDTPSSGQYWLNGKLVSEMDDDELAHIRNKEIGFVFQTFNLLPRATALHNVELPLIYNGTPRGQRIEMAKLALDRVDLTNRMDHKPNELSGGQRQRVAIARALLKNPAILILDEATSSLDSESERLVQEALEKLMQGRTTFVIAHRLSTVRRADRIVVLNEGRIVEEGTHEELLSTGGLYKQLYEIQFREFPSQAKAVIEN